MPGTRDWVPGAGYRYQVPGTRNLSPGTGTGYWVPGTGNQNLTSALVTCHITVRIVRCSEHLNAYSGAVSDAWCNVLGDWYLVPVACYLVQGIRYLARRSSKEF